VKPTAALFLFIFWREKHMTVAEMLQAPEVDVVTQSDLALAEMIELDERDLRELSYTEVHFLGNIVLQGEPEHPVIRVHSGPYDTIKRGGTKFKLYGTIDDWYQDGVDHGKAMRDKIGGINETDYSGGKTVANIDPNPEGMSKADKHHRIVDALDQLAGLVVEAGLADPAIDGTAGDEGTNSEIGKSFLRGLGRRGVPNYEACVTGKPDMRPRPAATGRGAAVSKRTTMRERGETEGTVFIQGAGFAGAYYAAEAFAPYDPADEDVTLRVGGLGDLDLKKRKVTLTTDDPEGLQITRSMVDAVLLDPTDRHVLGTKGDKLAALAWKLEDKGGSVQIRQQDILTFDPEGRWRNPSLAPAATSNVIRRDNIGSIVIKEIDEIGNHTVQDGLVDELEALGFNFNPGEVRNPGGVKMSIEENRRDLARIAQEKAGQLYLPVSDHEYEGRLHTTMTHATMQAHRVSREYGVNLRTAVKMVALGNYAIARNMHISDTMRSLLTSTA
jgi:glutamate dehydrogenase/leucine dehydrogenase